jgi:hypothetical protein
MILHSARSIYIPQSLRIVSSAIQIRCNTHPCWFYYESIVTYPCFHLTVRFQYKVDIHQRHLTSESNGMDSSSSQRHLCAKLELLSTSKQKEGVHPIAFSIKRSLAIIAYRTKCPLTTSDTDLQILKRVKINE